MSSESNFELRRLIRVENREDCDDQIASPIQFNSKKSCNIFLSGLHWLRSRHAQPSSERKWTHPYLLRLKLIRVVIAVIHETTDVIGSTIIVFQLLPQSLSWIEICLCPKSSVEYIISSLVFIPKRRMGTKGKRRSATKWSDSRVSLRGQYSQRLFRDYRTRETRAPDKLLSYSGKTYSRMTGEERSTCCSHSNTLQ